LAIAIALRFPLRVAVLDGDKEGFATVLTFGERCVASPLIAPPVPIRHKRLGDNEVQLYRAGAGLETASDVALGQHIMRAAADADVLFIDTSGDRTSPVVGATLALADIILTPVMPDFASLAGFEKTCLSASEMKSPARIYAVRSRWDVATRLGREVDAALLTDHRAALLDTRIRRDQLVMETTGAGMPVPLYAPSCRASSDFDALARELGALCGWVSTVTRPTFDATDDA
jgi:cellulose biosynthesis protein BcsQ